MNDDLTIQERILGAIAFISPLVAILVVGLVCGGCSTAEAPTAAKAQNITAKDITVNVFVDGWPMTNPPPVNVSVEIATAAQANETSGTDTLTASPTQTPTTDIKPTTTFTYGLSSTGAGKDWIGQLTSASAKGLAQYLRSRQSGEVTVTKRDGSTECVTCTDGSCTPAGCGECVTCDGGRCAP